MIVLLPHAVTGLRLLSAPLLWLLVTSLHMQAALACITFAIVSDILDGWLARRVGKPSRAGAYFDATADFAVIAAGFAAFAAIDVYPTWIVALITLVFLVFILSSHLTPAIYDPVGRYIGGILFAALGATTLFPDFLLHQTILWTCAGALVATLGGRMTFTVATCEFADTIGRRRRRHLDSGPASG